MSQTMHARKGSWPLTMNLESETTEQPIQGIAPLPTSGRANLSIVTVGPNIPMPPRYADIDEVVARAEKDPRRKAALVRARERLAETAYKGRAKGSIASIRLKRGWSQNDLSVVMGTSQSHIARIESGDDVRISTVVKLAAALKIGASEAFTLMTNKMRAGK